MRKRKLTRQIILGGIKIGGGAPVSVQSMTNTDTRDYHSTLRQIRKLNNVGCQIVRTAVPDFDAAKSFAKIAAKTPIPIVADIHFDYRLALFCAENGASGIRINPGNIGDENAVAKIANICGEKGVVIRVGANSGSLPAKFAKVKHPKDDQKRRAQIANALVESAIQQCQILEKQNFNNIKVSLKASDVLTTIIAYKMFSEKYDYPLHLGITEAGSLLRGTVKSTLGIGVLLLDGIGDTVRVSLTADPIQEVKVGIMILEAVGLQKACPEIISCPTCGRTELNIENLVSKIENEIESLKKNGKRFKPAKIAIMGCAVNGPGEAKDADIGISGAKNKSLVIFKKGQVIGSFSEEEALKKFKKIILELEEKS